MIGFDATVKTMVSLETSTLGRNEIDMEYIAILPRVGKNFQGLSSVSLIICINYFISWFLDLCSS